MAAVPTLDARQQAVVQRVRVAGHGPLLVLAGPGTGKTTTMVEAIAARVDAGTDPGRILTLTFSRRAASELRARIGQRLRRTVAAPLAFGDSTMLVGVLWYAAPVLCLAVVAGAVAGRTLSERQRFLASFVEHALIEFQPRQLAVEELGRRRSGRGFRHGRQR